MNENECMVLGCNKNREYRVMIGKNKVLYTCKECSENIRHSEKNGVEKL